MDSRLTIISILLVASASAAPSALLASPVAYAPGVVTATSSQVISRNYNGLAPIVPAAPYLAAPYVAPAASYVAPAAPYVAPAAPYVAPAASYVAPAAPYVAAPYAASYVW